MQANLPRMKLVLAAFALAVAVVVLIFEDRLISILDRSISRRSPYQEAARETHRDFTRIPKPTDLAFEVREGSGWIRMESAGPDGEELRALKLGPNSAAYRFNPAVGDVRLIHRVKNAGPGDLTYLKTYALYPSNLDRQEVVDLTFSPGDGQLTEDDRGQKIVAYQFEDVAPGATLETVWRARVRTWDLHYKIDPADVGPLDEVPEPVASEFLVDADIFRIAHPTVTEARDDALERETNPWTMARRIFDWVRNHIEYRTGGGWDDAVKVIERGSGSCSEYAFTFVAMCRSAGIPARWTGALVRGGPAKGPGPYRDNTHHRWAEVYMPRIGWVHCDVPGTWAYLPNSYLIVSQSSGPSDILHLDYDVSCDWHSAEMSGKVARERYALWYSHPNSFYTMEAKRVKDHTPSAGDLRITWDVLGEKEEAGKTLTLTVSRLGETVTTIPGLNPARGYVDVPVEAVPESGPDLTVTLSRSDKPTLAGYLDLVENTDH